MSDLKDTQYIDVLWLQTFGLNKQNVLDYFYTSPFFDKSSNNQQLRNQGVNIEYLNKMIGIEFTVDDAMCFEPHLYVIKKSDRINPQKSILLEVFYCLDGAFYQSPSFLVLLRARVSKVSNHLLSVYEELKRSILPIAETETTMTERNSRSSLKRKRNLPGFSNTIQHLSNINEM
jgi:mediator of RNA polymerase II transcription subunit 6